MRFWRDSRFSIASTMLLLFSISFFATAEEEVTTKRLPIELNKTLKMRYTQDAWNLKPESIDSSQIIMKDKATGRLILVKIQETEPDSGQFYGYFSIGWQDQKTFIPLIYIPPKNVTSEQEIKNLISAGKIKRKPYVMKKDESGSQTLEVFDTKDQAVAAYKRYRDRVKAKKEAEKPKPTPIPDESLLEAQRLAALEAEKQRLAEEARKREEERIRMEQLEEQRAKAAREKAAKMAAAQKAANKKKAKKLAQEAMAAYKAGDFVKAEELFKKSVKLDPENDTYYFQYGVTLYRTEKYNKSLVYLSMAKTATVSKAEKAYFNALNYLRLKEYEKAHENLDIAIASKDKNIAPSSAFYKGIIHYTSEEYNQARDAFQVVLDTSSDPKMDRQAETYIERIAKILQFKELQRKPFMITFLGALQQDSNILSVDASGATDGLPNKGKLDSMRTLASLDFAYRPIFTANHELNISVNGLTMTTADKGLSQVDPTILGAKIPYKYRGKLFGAGWQLSTTALYTKLAINGADFQNSTGINIDSTHIPGQKWAHTIKLGLSSDKPVAKATSTFQDSTASKTSIKYSASNFLNDKKNKAMSYDLGVTQNAATGENSTYTRIDLGVGYNMPAFWGTSFTSKLSYYTSSYATYYADAAAFTAGTSTKRTDSNLGLNLGLNRRFKDWLTGIASATYNNNTSTLSTGKYNKYTIMIGVLMNPRF